MNEEVFKEMTASFFSPEIQGCLSVVESIAGYKLSASDSQPFLYFHNYITNPQPDFITQWRSDPNKKNGIADLQIGLVVMSGTRLHAFYITMRD